MLTAGSTAGRLPLVKPFRVQVKAQDRLLNGIPEGVSLGWNGFDKFYTIPPEGQLNIVTGIPSSGKSEWLDSVSMNLAKTGWDIFVYSPECYPPDFYYKKLAEKYTGKPFSGTWEGKPNISKSELSQFGQFFEKRYTLVDTSEKLACIDDLLESIKGAFFHSEKKMVILDPFNKISDVKPGRGQNKTDYIGEVLTKVQLFAHKYNISFWIVVHPAKPMKLKDGSLSNLTLYDCADSSHFYNMIDNGFILSRSWDDKIKNTLVGIKAAKIKNSDYGEMGEHMFEFDRASKSYNDFYQ